MKETITIILPLPPRILSPNHTVGSRGGRFAKAAATKRFRKLAQEAVEASGIESGPWTLATASVVFWHASRRRRDGDNAIGSLKAAYDGLVSAGLLVDDDYDHLRREEPSFQIDAKNPRVEITITNQSPPAKVG